MWNSLLGNFRRFAIKCDIKNVCVVAVNMKFLVSGAVAQDGSTSPVLISGGFQVWIFVNRNPFHRWGSLPEVKWSLAYNGFSFFFLIRQLPYNVVQDRLLASVQLWNHIGSRLGMSGVQLRRCQQRFFISCVAWYIIIDDTIIYPFNSRTLPPAKSILLIIVLQRRIYSIHDLVKFFVGGL